jgi:hypothetical protein
VEGLGLFHSHRAFLAIALRLSLLPGAQRTAWHSRPIVFSVRVGLAPESARIENLENLEESACEVD